MKPMSVVECIKRKNDIIEKHTGIRLVPDDQIKEVEKRRLSMVSDSDACAYCKIYRGEDYCGECPMGLAGNECGMSLDNTYEQVCRMSNCNVITHCGNPWHKELESLIEEFNVSNGFE